MFSRSKRFAEPDRRQMCPTAMLTPAPGSYNVTNGSTKSKGVQFEKSKRFKEEKDISDQLSKTISQESLYVSATPSKKILSSSCSDLTKNSAIKRGVKSMNAGLEKEQLLLRIAELQHDLKQLQDEKQNQALDLARLHENEVELKNEMDRLLDDKSVKEQQFKDELLNLESKLTESLRSLSSKYESLEDAYDALKRDKCKSEEILRKELEITKASYENCKQDLETMHLTYKSLSERYEHLVQSEESIQSELYDLQDQVRLIKLKNESLCQEKEQLEGEKLQLERDLDQEKANHEEAKESFAKEMSTRCVESEELRKNVACLEKVQSNLNAEIESCNRNSSEILARELKIKEEFATRVIEAQAKITELEQELQTQKDALEAEQCKSDTNNWRLKYEELLLRMSPFQAQLDAYEQEKSLLLKANVVKEGEIASLSEKYVKILGHQNNKQKIKHVMKLKEENLLMKKELVELRSKERRDVNKIHDLERKLVKAGVTKTMDISQAFQSGKENMPRRVLQDSSVTN